MAELDRAAVEKLQRNLPMEEVVVEVFGGINKFGSGYSSDPRININWTIIPSLGIISLCNGKAINPELSIWRQNALLSSVSCCRSFLLSERVDPELCENG